MAAAAACAICGSAQRAVLYEGPIRTGGFGQVSAQTYTVFVCAGCGAGHLAIDPVDYESGDYRLRVDGSDVAEDFHRTHDGEQALKLQMMGTGGLREAVVMDVGCGGGSFLDLVKGMCRTTIGIEPTPSLRAAVTAKGHRAFPYCHDVGKEWDEQVDVAVSFSVIEHVPDPAALLREVRRLLKPGGRLVVSTPNRRDWLLEALPEEYPRFFYRAVHAWYLDAGALTRLLTIAGFVEPRVTFHHRYDLSNAILWLRDKRPTGLGALAFAAPGDGVFRGMLEASGRTDYLYAFARKP